MHGYPPGYRQRGNQRTDGSQRSNSKPTNVANVVAVPTQGNTEGSANVDDPFVQCHNILNMLQSKLNVVKSDANATTSYLAGICPSITNVDESKWIIDSGASTHICFSQASFKELVPVATVVILPDNKRIPVHYAGTVTVCGSIVLK